MRKAEKNNTIGAVFTIMVIISIVLWLSKSILNISIMWVLLPIWGYLIILFIAFIYSFIYHSYKIRNHERDSY